MEGIAKYVLEMAGQGKDEFYLPESKCIRVEDVEVGLDMMGHKKKVLTSVGLPELDDMYLQDFVDVDQLSVSPSPLLQDYMICQPEMDDGVTLTTYCERVSTVSMSCHL